MKLRLTLTAILVLAACGGDEADPTEAPPNGDSDIPVAAVDIDGFAFTPDAVSIAAGGQVTWTNSQGGIPHTVTADSGSWDADSGSLGDGDTFSFDFVEPGTYTYFCAIHPSMEGTITVSG